MEAKMRITTATGILLGIALLTQVPQPRLAGQAVGNDRYNPLDINKQADLRQATRLGSAPDRGQSVPPVTNGQAGSHLSQVQGAEGHSAAPPLATPQAPQGATPQPWTPGGNPSAAAPLQTSEVLEQDLPATDLGARSDLTGGAVPPAEPIRRGETESAAERSANSSATSAKERLSQLLSPPATAELPGEPINLATAMEGSYGRERQMEVISAYWQLAVAVGKYYVACQAREDLESGTSAGSNALSRLMVQSEGDFRQTKLDAVRAQHRLAQVLSWEPGRLPLPDNQPHVGTYRTRYDEIFASRTSRRAWELDQALPLLYDIVKARAEAVAGSELDPAAFRKAASQFLDAVGQYNLAIAEYAFLATGESLSGRDLVPLLIRASRQTEEEHVAGGRGASGKTSGLGSPAQRGGTIVDSQVVRTGGESARPARPERSVLMQPRGGSRTPTAATRVAESPRQEPVQRRTPRLADQWRRHDPSSAE
jgi:hypothetical protein